MKQGTATTVEEVDESHYDEIENLNSAFKRHLHLNSDSISPDANSYAHDDSIRVQHLNLDLSSSLLPKPSPISAIPTKLHSLFYSYSDFSLESGDLFLKQLNLVKLLKDAGVIPKVMGLNELNILISKEMRKTMLTTVNFD